jgi:hypothetical protein
MKDYEAPGTFRLKLTMDNMQLTVLRCINEHLTGLDVEISKAVKEICTPDNIIAEIRPIAEACLHRALKEEMEAYFRYGPGRKSIKAEVFSSLDRFFANQVEDKDDY